MGLELAIDNTRQEVPKHMNKRNVTKNGNLYIIKEKVKTKQKGDKAYPLKTLEEITQVIEYYEIKETKAKAGYKQLAARNKLLLTLGFNVGIRGFDLAKIKWCNVYDSNGNFLEPDNPEIDEKRTSQIVEQKTQKIKDLIFNDVVRKAFDEYVKKYNIDKTSDDYVFFNRQKTNPYISREQISEIIKEAVRECGIKRRVASHTLRKTFALFQMKAHQDDARFTSELMDLLNHDSEETTLHYVGLDVEKRIGYHNDVQLGKVSVIREHKKVEVNHDKETVVDKMDLEYLIKQLSEKCYTCSGNGCETCYNAILAKKYGYDLNSI